MIKVSVFYLLSYLSPRASISFRPFLLYSKILTYFDGDFISKFHENIVLFPACVHHCYLPTQYLFSIFFFFLVRMLIFFGREIGPFWAKERAVFSSIPRTLAWPRDKYWAKKHRPRSGGSFRHFFPNICTVSPSWSFFLSSSCLKCTQEAGDGATIHYEHRFPSFLGNCFYFSCFEISSSVFFCFCFCLCFCFCFFLSLAIASV